MSAQGGPPSTGEERESTANALPTVRSRLASMIRGGGLRLAFASNFTTYVLAVLASLATFRLMIALTDTPTVGLWALIVGFSATVGAAEMGLGSNLTRFVAARRDVSRRLLAHLSAVGAIMCLLPTALLALLAAWPIYRFAVARPDLPVDAGTVAALTAAALAVTFINATIAIFSGLAEGLGKVQQRGVSFMLYNVITLGGLWPALQAFGAVGIGVANLAGVSVQLMFVLTIFFLAARTLPRTAEDQTVGALLRTLFASTMQNFGIVLTRLTLEPVARFFVAISGSLTVQAWFELALRVSNQVRHVVVTSLGPLLFIGASDHEAMTRRFERPHAVTVRLAALLYLGLACGSPWISAVVLGKMEPGFIIFLLILGAGGAVSTAGLTGQYALSALGRFGVVLRIFVVAAVLNVVLGGLGVLAGGGAIGATAGLAAALAIKGVMMMRQHARMAGRTLWSRFGGFWAASGMAVITGGGLAFSASRLPVGNVLMLSILSCVLLLLPAWTLLRMFLRRDT